MQDRDLQRLRGSVRTKLNLEIGQHARNPRHRAANQNRPTFASCRKTARKSPPKAALDAHGQRAGLAPTLDALRAAGARVSLFIDPEESQIRASVDLGAPVIELHTGAFANATGEVQAAELTRLRDAAALGASLGLQVNAGHGLSYQNLPTLLGVMPHLCELNIGHSIVSRALFVGLERAVGEMLKLMEGYRL